MFFLPVAVFIVFLVLAGVRIVKQQTAAIVETFGRYSRTLKPGLNWIIPFVQNVARVVDLRIRELQAQVEVKTRDNMFVSLPVAIMVQAVEERAADAYYQLANPAEQVSTWVLNTLRSSTASMELQELYEDRQRLAAEVEEALVERLSAYGYRVVGVLVDQPTVSAEVQASFNRVVTSQREKEAAEQEAQALRIRIVGEARAEAEAQELRAQGLAKARAILSESLTEAVTRAKQEGLHEDDIMNLLLETNRLDTIRAAADTGRLVLMDVRGPGSERLVVPV
ncbi:SPFH domain-containing protein, partial [Gulbenkiania mobilis]